MFLRFASIWLLGFSQVSCAQPIYEQVSQTPVSVDDSKSTNDSCDLIFGQLGYCLKWDWIQYPTSTQAGSLWVKVTRPNEFDGSAVPVELEFNPEVILWMPTMGHGSSPTQVEKVDVGTYAVKNVFFVMPGEWEIRFQVIGPQQVADEIIVPIRF